MLGKSDLFVPPGSNETKALLQVNDQFPLPSTHLLHYNQVFCYITSCCPNASKSFYLSMIDCLLNKRTYFILDIYNSTHLDVNTTMAEALFKNWHNDLPEDDLGDKILESYLKVGKCITNKTWRETQFKWIHRAFIPFLPSNSTSQFSTMWVHKALTVPSLLALSSDLHLLGLNYHFHTYYHRPANSQDTSAVVIQSQFTQAAVPWQTQNVSLSMDPPLTLGSP